MNVQFKLKTKIGIIYLLASEENLTGILWTKQNIPLTTKLSLDNKAHRILSTASIQIEEYLAGQRTTFSLPFQMNGTPFQKRVWEELLKVPYGKTLSYKELAKKVGSPNAVRAVGTANGKNLFSLIVPCHRIIASDGTLAGYAGGISIKEKLLALEKSLFAKNVLCHNEL